MTVPFLYVLQIDEQNLAAVRSSINFNQELNLSDTAMQAIAEDLWREFGEVGDNTMILPYLPGRSYVIRLDEIDMSTDMSQLLYIVREQLHFERLELVTATQEVV